MDNKLTTVALLVNRSNRQQLYARHSENSARQALKLDNNKQKKAIFNNKEEQVFPTYSHRFHLLQSKHVTGQKRSKENRESKGGHAIPHYYHLREGKNISTGHFIGMQRVRKVRINVYVN